MPVSVIEHVQQAASHAHICSTTRATADLITMAFFFLLRVGEYTMPRPERCTRTIQFRVQDVRFYRDGIIIPNNAPATVLAQADGVALCISNQKNGTRGETIHHHRLPNRRICPVAATARRVAAIMTANHDQTTPISFVTQHQHISASAIRTTVRRSVTQLQLHRRGIRATDVGSHSLRAGGAMAMKLNGCDLVTIMKTGRWTSLTFLTYIHNQIAHLGANISGRMANPVPFFSF